MQKFVIERNIKGIGDYSPDKLEEITRKVQAALKNFAGRLYWHESFLTKDKVFTIVIAADEATVREYSKAVDLPADNVHPVIRVVDPSTE